MGANYPAGGGHNHLFPMCDYVHGLKKGEYRIQATGEFRPPKKGEWYISGAIPAGYYAPNDLNASHYIGQLVEVRVVMEVVRVL